MYPKVLLSLFCLFLIGCQPSLASLETPQSAVPIEIYPTIVEPKPSETVAAPTIMPTITAATLMPSSTPTATLTPTLPPASATPFLPVSWQEMVNPEFGVAWLVPRAWWDVSDTLFPDTLEESLFWSAWANDQQAAQRLSGASHIFPEGLIIVSLQINSGDADASLLSGVSRENEWGQSLSFTELNGENIAPFSLHLALSTVRAGYLYDFSLKCAPPSEADSSQQNAFIAQCRTLWNLMSNQFGLCAVSQEPTAEPGAWQQVSNEAYQYAFDVPANWEPPRETPENLTFFSLPVNKQPFSCPLPDRFMKLDFFAQPPGNFAVEGQQPQEGAPDFAQATEITVADLPAWLFEPDRETDEEGGNFTAENALLYIKGPKYWYTFTLYCSPEWTAECQEVWDHLLESFQLLP